MNSNSLLDKEMTVIVVPHMGGKTYNFHVRQKILIGIAATGFFCTLLVVVNLIAFVFRTIYHYGTDARRQQEEITYQTKYNRLEKLHTEYMSESDEKIKTLEEKLEKIAGFAGFPIEQKTPNETESGKLVTEKESMGKGGPLMSVAVLVHEEVKTLVEDIHAGHFWLKTRIGYIDQLILSAEKILSSLEEREKLLTSTPLILPLETSRYTYTDGYGYRIHPLYKKRDFHKGQDIAAGYGTPIIAPADGTVKYAARKHDYGLLIEIDHGYGISCSSDTHIIKARYKTRYAHLARLKVKAGQKVKRGDIIGSVGSTGMSTGNHLHYEVWKNGKTVDPKMFILND